MKDKMSKKDCPYLDPYAHDGYWEMNCKLLKKENYDTECTTNWEEYKKCNLFKNHKKKE